MKLKSLQVFTSNNSLGPMTMSAETIPEELCEQKSP
mgnify:CR=1 FL=1